MKYRHVHVFVMVIEGLYSLDLFAYICSNVGDKCKFSERTFR